MALIVQKFGGSSVADAERIFRVAGRITKTYAAGNDVVVVLSAQGDTTDDLIAKAEEINPNASRREMDMLLACGEQQSIALMAMAIEKMGYPVVSLCGWQVGITTNSNHSDARIRRVDCDRVRQELDRKRIVLVAGFQGVDRSGDVTTLGRGGSDTTAVAMAVALAGGSLPDLYGRRRRVHERPARGAGGEEARRDHVQRDAGAGIAGRAGAPQPVGRAGKEL